MKPRRIDVLAGEVTLKLGALLSEVKALIEERDGLRASLKAALRRTSSDPGSKEAQVLRDALDGKQGWREEARQVLGLFEWVTCEGCGRQFESGGKRKKHCGEC